MSANLLIDIETESSNLGTEVDPHQATSSRTPWFSLSGLSLEDNPWEESSVKITSASANALPDSQNLSSAAQDTWVRTSPHEDHGWNDIQDSQITNNEQSLHVASNGDSVWGDVAVLGRRADDSINQSTKADRSRTAWPDMKNFEPPAATTQVDSFGDKDLDRTWDDYDNLDSIQCEIAKAPSNSQHHLQKSSRRPPAERDENVLFDADDDYHSTSDDSDDFGTFESAIPASKPRQNLTRNTLERNLLDFDVVATSAPQLTPQSENAPRTVDLMDEFEDWEPEPPSRDNSLATSNVLTPTIAKQPAAEEPWDDFEDGPTVPDNYENSNRNHIQEQNLQKSGTFESLSSRTNELSLPFHVTNFLAPPDLPSNVTSAPPANIPPPSILLSLFHPLLSTILDEFLEPLFDLEATEREPALRHPSIHDVLSSCVAIGATLSHIIAGRKSRWKRDIPLAQSMRIGPAAASSSRTSGMKLAGVDRTEIAKEDREVAEVIRIWRSAISGRLRTGLAASGLRSNLPELDQVMAVRIAKQEEGALSAPKPCVLCGLKREERVIKSDIEVEDSFGEWWIDHWGHRDCRSFWESQRSNLARR